MNAPGESGEAFFLTLILRGLKEAVSKDEDEKKKRNRASSSFEMRAAQAPQDEEALHPIAVMSVSPSR
jgi:phage terminase small subunit